MRINVLALLGSLALVEAYFKPIAPKVQTPKLFSLAARAPKLRWVEWSMGGSMTRGRIEPGVNEWTLE